MFIFKRPEETKKVVAQIAASGVSKVYVFADGPRRLVPEDRDLVRQARKVIDLLPSNIEVIRVFAESNLGLRERLMTGLDYLFARESEAIILEDDCLPARDFFRFASQLLGRYRDNEMISMIGGFNYAIEPKYEFDYFFVYGAPIWGWATWARTWHAFRAEPQVESWANDEVAELRKTFHFGSERRDFIKLMKIAPGLNTWDVSLDVHLRAREKLAIVPSVNLIENIGFGASATHTHFEAFELQSPIGSLTLPLKHPTSVAVDPNLQRRRWIRRKSRWISFPIANPISFVRIVVRFLRLRTSI